MIHGKCQQSDVVWRCYDRGVQEPAKILERLLYYLKDGPFEKVGVTCPLHLYQPLKFIFTGWLFYEYNRSCQFSFPTVWKNPWRRTWCKLQPNNYRNSHVVETFRTTLRYRIRSNEKGVGLGWWTGLLGHMVKKTKLVAMAKDWLCRGNVVLHCSQERNFHVGQLLIEQTNDRAIGHNWRLHCGRLLP